MIKFVNTDTGAIYDGAKPFLHTIKDDGGDLSANLCYTNRLVFITNAETANVSINDPFKLIDTTKIDKDSLADMVTNTLSLSGVSLGQQYDNLYIYSINIFIQSSTIGTLIEDLNINGESYNVCADIYNQNEALGVNLSNMGIEISESIQKALYDSNVREELKDNIGINEKFKELLINYWDIFAKKGSYKSLLDSLKWFEYNDFIILKEFWNRKNSILADTYFTTVVNNIVDENVRELLKNNSKTTYIGIYCALNNLSDDVTYEIDLDANYNIEDNILLHDPIPVLYQTVHKWTKEDMSLKMKMLEIFYSTYFTPIHIHTLHCTVENMVFSSLKIINGARSSRLDLIDNAKTFSSSLKKYTTAYTTDCTSKTYIDTIFGNALTDVDWPESNGTAQDNLSNSNLMHAPFIVGSDPSDKILNSWREVYAFLSQYSNKYGVIIPITDSIELFKNAFIHKAHVKVSKLNNGEWDIKNNKTYYLDIQSIDNITVNDWFLFISEPGLWNIQYTYTDNASIEYTRSAYVNLLSSNIDLSTFKLENLDNQELSNLLSQRNDLFGYAGTSNIPNTAPDWSTGFSTQTSTLPYLLLNERNGTTNSTILIDLKRCKEDSISVSIRDKYANAIYYPQSEYSLISQLQSRLPHYYWVVMRDENSNPSMLLGIRKYYTDNTQKTTTYNFIFNSKYYRVSITQTYCNDIDIVDCSKVCNLYMKCEVQEQESWREIESPFDVYYSLFKFNYNRVDRVTCINDSYDIKFILNNQLIYLDSIYINHNISRYSSDDYKVYADLTTQDNNIYKDHSDYISEQDLYLPILHKKHLLNTYERCNINKDDVIYIEPDIKYFDRPDTYIWNIDNVSSRDKYIYSNSKNHNATLWYPTPGYYNVKFSWKIGNITREISQDSLFRVLK